MRQGSGPLIALSVLAFTGACGPPLYPPVDGQQPGAVSDAAVTDAAGQPLCKGATPLAEWTPDPGAPHVTLSDDAGQGCVFLMGDALADSQTCGQARLSAYTEDCPFTAVDFDVWSDPGFMTEFAVQGAYAWAHRSGALQNGRVLEMTIDSNVGALTEGHFRLAFDPAIGFDAVTANGTFALCTSPGVSVEPCRQPSPPPN